MDGSMQVPCPSDPSHSFRDGLARLNSDSPYFSVDPSFDAGSGPGDVPGGYQSVSDIAIQPDGKILVGGAFASFNGQPRLGVVRLNSDGSLDPSFVTDWSALSPTLNVSVNRVALQPDGRILIAGGFNYSGNYYYPAYYRLFHK